MAQGHSLRVCVVRSEWHNAIAIKQSFEGNAACPVPMDYGIAQVRCNQTIFRRERGLPRSHGLRNGARPFPTGVCDAERGLSRSHGLWNGARPFPTGVCGAFGMARGHSLRARVMLSEWRKAIPYGRVWCFRNGARPFPTGVCDAFGMAQDHSLQELLVIVKLSV